MTNKRDFNIRMMQEIGLEVDKNGNVIDQDSGTKLAFKDKNIKYGSTDRKDEVEFDPLNNPPMMNSLFNYYLDKLGKEGRYISTYYKSDTEKGEKGCIKLKEHTKTIESGSFYNDSVKYADLILKLNESKMNLESYDSVSEETNRKNGTK